MANNFLILGTLAALGWVFVDGPPPTRDPTAQSPASRVAVANSSAIPHVLSGQTLPLEARRAPVPLVRNFRAPPASTSSADAPPAATEQQVQDDLDRKAARAAVELDGYKRVSIVGKASNGAWRAKGYRGATEVLLTVDGTGRVSMN
jgi:hypothetical protein